MQDAESNTSRLLIAVGPLIVFPMEGWGLFLAGFIVTLSVFHSQLRSRRDRSIVHFFSTYVQSPTKFILFLPDVRERIIIPYQLYFNEKTIIDI